MSESAERKVRLQRAGRRCWSISRPFTNDSTSHPEMRSGSGGIDEYRGALVWASTPSDQEFRSPEFQKRLWELDDISSIGPGSSVTVPGAYTDPEIVEALWHLRSWQAPDDPKAKAQHLDREFERIIALVSPRHNKRRPSARLVVSSPPCVRMKSPA